MTCRSKGGWRMNWKGAAIAALALLGATLGASLYMMDLYWAEEARADRLEAALEAAEAEREPAGQGGAERAPEAPEAVEGMVFPVAEGDYLRLTSPFGLRVSPFLGVEAGHQGLDIATVWRAQVVSVADGEVVEHWPPPDGYFKGHPTYGGVVVVDHGEFSSLYAHLSWTRVHTGQRVRAGEVLGRVGDTGLADGQHLHFELLVGGQAVNPLLYLPEPGR